MKCGPLATAALGLSLTACAQLTPELQLRYCSTVEQALTSSPSEVRSLAERGNGRAQLSYSIVLTYGLNGTPVDSSLADVYRSRAVASRGTTTSAIYVPGVNGASGHTQLVSVPRYDVTEQEALSVEQCAGLLSTRRSVSEVAAELQEGVCGGESNYVRLSGLWARAAG